MSSILSSSLEITGEITNNSDFNWNNQNFAGFFYDIDKDIGSENITINISNNNLLSEKDPYGIKYETYAQLTDFKFKQWGSYSTIGFIGDSYLASYLDDSIMSIKCENENTLLEGQIEKIIIDDDHEGIIEANESDPKKWLNLKDGYMIKLKAVDVNSNKVLVELLKDNESIDSKIINPSRDLAYLNQSTYYYKENVGGLDDLTIIAVHFEDSLFSQGISAAMIDGVWRISEKPTWIEEVSSEETPYDNMTVINLDTGTMKITMANDDKEKSVKRNKKIYPLLGNIGIKVADNDTLRYSLFSEYNEPGNYEVRSSIAKGSHSWNHKNFAGFYYDINQDIGREMITANVTEGRVLRGDKPYGINYQTNAQGKEFEFNEWGYYNVIGFLGDQYFAGYLEEEYDPINNSYLSYVSEDENLMGQEQLTKVLNDNDDEITIPVNVALKLSDGYELICTGTDSSGNKVYVELHKDSKIIDNKIVEPSSEIAEKQNYIYKKDLNGNEDIVIIATHFKNILKGNDQDYVTIDGIWQISEEPVKIEPGTHYDKMTILSVDPYSLEIKMANKNKKISLKKDKTRRIIYRSSNVPWMVPMEGDEDISVMGNIRIKVADNDTLRYCLLHNKHIETTNIEENLDKSAPAEAAIAKKENITASRIESENYQKNNSNNSSFKLNKPLNPEPENNSFSNIIILIATIIMAIIAILGYFGIYPKKKKS